MTTTYVYAKSHIKRELKRLEGLDKNELLKECKNYYCRLEFAVMFLTMITGCYHYCDELDKIQAKYTLDKIKGNKEDKKYWLTSYDIPSIYLNGAIEAGYDGGYVG